MAPLPPAAAHLDCKGAHTAGTGMHQHPLARLQASQLQCLACKEGKEAWAEHLHMRLACKETEGTARPDERKLPCTCPTSTPADLPGSERRQREGGRILKALALWDAGQRRLWQHDTGGVGAHAAVGQRKHTVAYG